MKSFFFLLILLASNAHAYRLLEVKAVSTSRKTFITRHGKADGVFVGKKGTFTTDDSSFIAKAKTVSREFTQWEVVNEEMIVPFETGDLVTFNDASEYLWTLTPSETRKEYLKKYHYVDKEAFIFKTSITRNLSSTVSNTSANSESGRGGIFFEGHYEKTFTREIRLNAGMRYEKELINVVGAQLETYRIIALAGITYQFEPLGDFADTSPYVALNIGYGLSGTQTAGFSQRGVVALLPSLKAGVSVPLNDLFDFLTELGVESMASREDNETNPATRTDQINSFATFGIRRYF